MEGELSQGASKDVSRQFSAMEEEQRRTVMSLANSYEDNNEAGGGRQNVTRQRALRHFCSIAPVLDSRMCWSVTLSVKSWDILLYRRPLTSLISSCSSISTSCIRTSRI